jgi:hypothetical protein
MTAVGRFVAALVLGLMVGIPVVACGGEAEGTDCVRDVLQRAGEIERAYENDKCGWLLEDSP